MNRTNEETFFKLGGTLPADAPSYLVRDADQQLLGALLGGEFCYLLNSRQMGKSSLCVRAVQELQRRGVRTVYVELSEIGGAHGEAATWYATLLNRIGRDLGLHREFAEHRRERADMTPVSSLFSALEEIALARDAAPVVIILDEIDCMRSLRFGADEFLGALRALYNRRANDPALRRLTFCLVGSATPADLVSDTRLSPFNIGERIDLRDFTRAEAAPLAAGLRGDGRDSGALLDRAYYWTGGHPFLTQSACARIARESAIRTESDVDALVAGMFFSVSARRDNVHLADVSNRMLTRKTGEIDPADDAQKATILALYEQVWRGHPRIADDETNPLVALLKLSGVVGVTGGALRIRNRIYERVFGEQWIAESRPDAENRRLQAAAERGRRQVGLIAARIIFVMTGLTGWAVVATIKAQRQTKRASDIAGIWERDSYTANMNLIQQHWENNNVDRVLKLLDETKKYEDRGFEWEYWNRLCHLDLKTLKGHGDRVNSIAFSPDGRRIATGSGDNMAQIWDANTGGRIAVLKGAAWVMSIALAPDSKRVVTGHWDHTARVWDTDSGKEISVLKGHTDSVLAVAFSPDGKYIATGSADNTVRLWDAETAKEIVVLKYNNWVFSVAFSPDGKRIVAGGGDHGCVIVWEVESGREIQVFRGHSGPVFAAAFSPDGKRIVTGGETAKVWEVESGRVILNFTGHDNVIRSAAFSPDGSHIVTSSEDRTAQVWDAGSGKVTLTLRGHSDAVSSAAFSPDGKRIVTGSWDKTARIWDSRSSRATLDLKGHTARVSSVAFSPDGERMVTGSWDKTARVWDAKSGKALVTLKGHNDQIRSVAFSPDGRRIVTGSIDWTAKVWDVESGKETTLRLGKHNHWVNSVAFSPDGKRILTGGWDGTANLWDAISGKLVFALTGLDEGVTAVAFSPDGKRILTGSRIAQVWDARTGREIFALRGHSRPVSAVAFSHDGRYILTGSEDTTIKIWDAARGTEGRTLNGHRHRVSTVAFSPDSRRIITGSDDGTAKVWDAESGKETLTLKGNGFGVCAALSPDGARIITGDSDAMGRVWDSRQENAETAFKQASNIGSCDQ